MGADAHPEAAAVPDGWLVDDTPDDHFVHLVGPLLTRMEGPQRRFAFQVGRKHLSRFKRLHGGMLLFLADKAMAVTAWHLLGQPKLFATIQLDLQFMSVVEEGSLVEAHCELTRRTGSLAFMNGRLLVGSELVASATGVWKFTS